MTAGEPFGNADTALTRMAEAERIKLARRDRWRTNRYAVDELRRRPEGWAQKVVTAADHWNAGADPTKNMPKLMARGDELVKAEASDVELASLHALTPAEMSALQLESAALREDQRSQVRTLARKIAAERETTVAPPEPSLLSDLLDEPDYLVQYIVSGVWPAGGRVLLAAQYKAGKSTLVGNVVRPLVDGGLFLDAFAVTPVGKVVLIDTELDRRTLRRWLRDQGITNTDAVTVVSLRGAVSTFDIIDASIRKEWAEKLAGANVVILDCLRPVLDGLGLSEDKDAGKFLVAFDALLAEIGATEGLVVTHMGHQGERARGDSRLLDWPDSLWKIVRDDGGDRRTFFTAHGRDVDVPEGLLTFDAETRHLSFSGGRRPDTAANDALLLEMVTAAPGQLSKSDAEERLTKDHGLLQKDARETIKRATDNGTVAHTVGAHRRHYLWPAADHLTLPEDVSNLISNLIHDSEVS